MELLERFEEAAEARRESRDSLDPSRGAKALESRTHCAYNQTRECFLGLEVKTVDLPPVRAGELISERPLRSGEGIWMTPFRGIPAATVPAPLDLIYLDEDCRVIDTVESFPTFQVSVSSPRPESVLALPAHSIYSSQTQPGDQLVLCVAEEMGRQLQRLSNPRNVAAAALTTIVGAALLRDCPLWSSGPGVLELEDRSEQADKAARRIYRMDLAQPGAKSFKPPHNWGERWWSPDPRKAPRGRAAALSAYYWNGSFSTAHRMPETGPMGLYAVTEDRWYPATLVVMTLARGKRGDEVAERAVAVESRAVRWEPDGVGLQFVLSGAQDRKRGRTPTMDEAGRIEIERFLDRLET